jgi:hypothetical protein
MTNAEPNIIIDLALLFAVLTIAIGGTIHALRNPKTRSDDGSSYYVG